MKLVVIGDIHGRDIWKQIIAKEQDADEFVFVGDYFDSFRIKGPDQINNFLDIIEFKKQSKVPVILLIGNHDYHYINSSETYSGFQHGASSAINFLLYENRKHLQMCYQMGDFLFTHAGVSYDWLKINKWEGWESVEEKVNDLWEYTPNAFAFAGRDPYGDSTISSPIWIRPHSLQKANRDTLRDQFIQVVGHTTQGKIDTEGKSTGGRYYYIDTLGTSGEYMILEQTSMDNGEIKFNTYKR